MFSEYFRYSAVPDMKHLYFTTNITSLANLTLQVVYEDGNTTSSTAVMASARYSSKGTGILNKQRAGAFNKCLPN